MKYSTINLFVDGLGRTVFRLYSKGCEYAIRALMHVAPTNGTKRFQARTICEKAGIPEPFTRKVFQSLVSGGFLEAARGPGGGYHLTEDPRRITILEIIKAVDGEEVFDKCVMGLPQCNESKPCPLHEIWSEARNDLLAQMNATSLQDLIEVQKDREGQG